MRGFGAESFKMVKPAPDQIPAPPGCALRSMTGFASLRGGTEGAAGWLWEIRSVNGKGLDLRLRLPEGIEGLEPALRGLLTMRIARGSVSVSLRLQRGAGGEVLRVNAVGLAAAVAALAQAEAAAQASGLPTAPVSPAEILALRGVLEQCPEAEAPGSAALQKALLADIDPLIDAFDAMRAAEGAALAALITAQLDRVAALAAEARIAAEARRDEAAAALRAAMARVMAAESCADPARVAQEVALLAVKSDVTEELDRLDAHVTAARALMAAAGPVGRKFDFLIQEFMREANTLCAKAGNPSLTGIGLDLKHVIDQMREQVQNVE